MMGICEFKINTEEGIIYSFLSGNIRYMDVVIHIESITEDYRFSPDFHSLAVIKENTKFNFLSPGSNENMKGMLEKYIELRPNSKWALVTPMELTTIIDSAVGSLGDISNRFRIFKERTEAETWLKE